MFFGQGQLVLQGILWYLFGFFVIGIISLQQIIFLYKCLQKENQNMKATCYFKVLEYFFGGND